jgi:hypothetical protein
MLSGQETTRITHATTLENTSIAHPIQLRGTCIELTEGLAAVE